MIDAHTHDMYIDTHTHTLVCVGEGGSPSGLWYVGMAGNRRWCQRASFCNHSGPRSKPNMNDLSLTDLSLSDLSLSDLSLSDLSLRTEM